MTNGFKIINTKNYGKKKKRGMAIMRENTKR
jgi:hypothetical protein